MIYELRTYWAAEGKAEALHARFREVTMGLFRKHGLQVVGFWVPQTVSAESGDLIYVLQFADEAAMKKAWEGFRADPLWLETLARTEKDGRLAARVQSIVMHSTDYAPQVSG